MRKCAVAQTRETDPTEVAICARRTVRAMGGLPFGPIVSVDVVTRAHVNLGLRHHPYYGHSMLSVHQSALGRQVCRTVLPLCPKLDGQVWNLFVERFACLCRQWRRFARRQASSFVQLSGHSSRPQRGATSMRPPAFRQPSPGE